MSQESKQSRGIGFFTLLGLLFIGLKLGGVINWSWWLVLLPLYGPLAVALVLVTVFLLGAVAMAVAVESQK